MIDILVKVMLKQYIDIKYMKKDNENNSRKEKQQKVVTIEATSFIQSRTNTLSLTEEQVIC